MGRWEPNAALRLIRAAVDEFTERSYDSTTVAQIAERAGLTKATFFRHFPDKREVLFAGQQAISAQLIDGIATAPASATPLQAVAAGLDLVTASHTSEQREFGPRLRAVVAANGELQEREASKRAGLAAAMAGALRERGVPETTALLAAELGVHAYYQAFDRWTDTANRVSFTDLARRALEELHAAAAGLS